MNTEIEAHAYNEPGRVMEAGMDAKNIADAVMYILSTPPELQVGYWAARAPLYVHTCAELKIIATVVYLGVVSCFVFYVRDPRYSTQMGLRKIVLTPHIQTPWSGRQFQQAPWFQDAMVLGSQTIFILQIGHFKNEKDVENIKYLSKCSRIEK